MHHRQVQAAERWVGGMTSYLGGIYEIQFDVNNQIVKQTCYYAAEGAMEVIEAAGTNVYYLLKNNLGSADMINP